MNRRAALSWSLALACAAGMLTLSSAPADAVAQSAPFQSYKIVRTYAHDSGCFTQGLQWTGTRFLESCGLEGKSNLREVTLDGKVVRQKALPKEVFAEGVVRLAGRIYQLTWQQGYGFVHDASSFADLGKFQYPAPIKEGWGLTTDGRSLIFSDGSSKLYWLDPRTYAVQRSVTVRNGDSEVSQLNELEFINNEVWANVWMTDLIARIDPRTGRVNAWVNLAGLRPASAQGDGNAVLNGIAFDAARNRLFVTGKTWDKLFEISVVRP